MPPIRLASLTLVLVILSIVPGHAQLGPRDGENLPPTDLERVKVGDTAPDFTLEDLNGKRISLSDFKNKKNVVLVFYRGQW
jgi:cytochrome oxidase Cu insertion factor (SCO1/SenC/PrrC family)